MPIQPPHISKLNPIGFWQICFLELLSKEINIHLPGGPCSYVTDDVLLKLIHKFCRNAFRMWNMNILSFFNKLKPLFAKLALTCTIDLKPVIDIILVLVFSFFKLILHCLLNHFQSFIETHGFVHFTIKINILLTKTT